jgi:hypothetical protein
MEVINIVLDKFERRNDLKKKTIAEFSAGRAGNKGWTLNDYICVSARKVV